MHPDDWLELGALDHNYVRMLWLTFVDSQQEHLNQEKNCYIVLHRRYRAAQHTEI